MTTRREDIDFPRSRAILVSTSAYSVGFGRVGMPAAANSLAAMRAALVGPCEWPGSRIHELADRSNRDGALQDIAALIHETSDVLIFYYVGHGQLLPGNDLGLALTDTSEDPTTAAVDVPAAEPVASGDGRQLRCPREDRHPGLLLRRHCHQILPGPGRPGRSGAPGRDAGR